MEALKYLLVLLCLALIHGAFAKEYIDLSYEFDNDTLVYPGNVPFRLMHVKGGYTSGGFWLESNRLTSGEHVGTHMDSPSHTYEGAWTVDKVPLSHLIAPGVMVDIHEKVKDDPNAELTTNDLMDWLDDHGPLPDGVVVFVYTGWSKRYGNKTAYLGTDTSDSSKGRFPGINTGAAQILTGYEAATGRRVVGVGIDTPSLDRGSSTDLGSHVEFSKNNIYGLENVANLERLPPTGFSVVVMPMKIRGGSGGPARIVATLPSDNGAPAAAQALLLPLVTSAAMLLRCL